MILQAVLFDIHKWNTRSAAKWLIEHNMKPIKQPRRTLNFIRYRIHEPISTKEYYSTTLNNGVILVNMK